MRRWTWSQVSWCHHRNGAGSLGLGRFPPVRTQLLDTCQRSQTGQRDSCAHRRAETEGCTHTSFFLNCRSLSGHHTHFPAFCLSLCTGTWAPEGRALSVRLPAASQYPVRPLSVPSMCPSCMAVLGDRQGLTPDKSGLGSPLRSWVHFMPESSLDQLHVL